MTTGSLIGAVVGGVIGFFVGGPVGAYYGAFIGFVVGMVVDPLEPDVASIGAPSDVQENVMSSTIGNPIKDLVGTGKITGHLLCYGNERLYTVPQQEQSGGKGGGSVATVVSGADAPGTTTYWMTWALGICRGPVSVLYAVYKGEDLVWDGKLECPDTGGQETITLDGMGECTFYFGTDDQTANVIINDLIPDSTLNSPMRNFCWALLDDCTIGKINRTPTLSFMVTKHPVCSFSEQNVIQEYDYNPAHAMWYVLHNMAGLPESWLNESAFSSLALSLLREYRGVSVLFTEQKDAIQYLTTLTAHIDCILNYDSSGKFTPKLIRGDYSIDGLPLVDENVLLDVPTVNRKSWIDTVSEIKVQYTELIEVEREKILAGSVYGCGPNNYYLIDSDVGSGIVFKELTRITPYAEKFLGVPDDANGSLFLFNSDGKVWRKGNNLYGQLGVGNFTTPVQYWDILPEISDYWLSITGSNESSFGIDFNGKLHTCGRNTGGQLAIGTYNVSKSSWQDEYSGRAFTFVGSADTRTLAGSNGVYYGIGSNSYYAFGVGNVSTSIRFVWENLFLNGVINYLGGNAFGLALVGSEDNFVIYSAGSNSKGRCGVNRTDAYVYTWEEIYGSSSWKSVSVALQSSCAIKTDGTLWAWGSNDQGQLGLGDYNYRILPTQVGSDDDWKKCSMGTSHMAVLKNNGTIWSCGKDEYSGTLGQGDKWHVLTLEQEITKGIWLDIGSKSGGILAMK